jgi:predicted nucleotidyltransferase
MHTAISEHVLELRALCGRFGAVRLEVFGSAARGVDFDPGRSDADFLVEFDPATPMAPLEQFFGLAQAIAQVLGRPVDLVETSGVRNPYLLVQMNLGREIIHAT